MALLSSSLGLLRLSDAFPASLIADKLCPACFFLVLIASWPRQERIFFGKKEHFYTLLHAFSVFTSNFPVVPTCPISVAYSALKCFLYRCSISRLYWQKAKMTLYFTCISLSTCLVIEYRNLEGRIYSGQLFAHLSEFDAIKYNLFVLNT